MVRHTRSWARDGLSKYQVHGSGEYLALVPAHAAAPDTPFTTLVRREDGARQILHTTLAAFSLLAASPRITAAYKSRFG